MPLQNSDLLRSGGIRDFISHRPGFLIRWGIPVFFILLLSIATGTYFIQFPDIVKASAKVNSINPPKTVLTKSGGRLIKLFKGDQAVVTQGDIIGYMESNARHEEVIKLSDLLDTLQYLAENNRLEEIPAIWQKTLSAQEKEGNHSFAHLGELQSSHQAFMQGFISFKDYLNTGFYVSKKQLLKTDLGNIQRLLHQLQLQKQLQQQDLAITIQNYNVHDTLHNESLITDLEYRSQKSQLINKKMTIPQMNASIIGNQNQQTALKKEMMELDNQVTQQKASFIQLLNAYKNTVEEWKQKFIIKATTGGTFIHAGFLETEQQLQDGQIIGFITNVSNQYYAEMLIPQTNFGKVKEGQDVLLKFPSYPSQEFGSVKGRIEYIKNIPSDSGYLAKVILPGGLITNYKKIIVFQEGLTSQAEIITERKRLSERLFGEIRSLIN